MTKTQTRFFIGDHELSWRQTEAMKKLFRRREDLMSPCAPWQMPDRKLMEEFVWPRGIWSERRLSRLLKEHADRAVMAFKQDLIRELEIEEKVITKEAIPCE